MITGIWINGDRLAVLRNEDEITIIDTSTTYPDDVSFECMRAADLGEEINAEWVMLLDLDVTDDGE